LVGTVQRRWVYIGGGLVVVIVGYAYLARRRSASAAPTIDPATGSLAGGGYVNPVPDAVGGSAAVDSTPDSIDTNSAWVLQVLGDLESLGWDAQFAASALGKYLAGSPVTSDELNLIRTARGLRGNPPEGAPEPLVVPGGGPPSQPPPSGEIKAVAYAGSFSDEWINAQTAAYGTYYHQLILWNPGFRANITNDPVPAHRKFIRTETYTVKK
jgi:hypothetical protein